MRNAPIIDGVAASRRTGRSRRPRPCTAGLAHSSPDDLGNADTWTAAAIWSTPRPGDVAQWDDNHNWAGPMGHVAFVGLERTGFTLDVPGGRPLARRRRGCAGTPMGVRAAPA